MRKSGDQGTSKSNELEARACASLVAYLCNQASDYNVRLSRCFIAYLTHCLVCEQDWYCDAVQGTAEDIETRT